MAKKQKSKSTKDNSVNESQERSFKYDMRPPAGILNVFSRLNYKAHYAIAEFVDNSTQSYLLHADHLDKSSTDYEMAVQINYDDDSKALTVEDNAYGMERDRFLDAITLDAKNSEQVNSRNEFGMGLKTAASWFGNVWSVSSTALGSLTRYTAIIDIPELQRTGENDVDVVVSEADLAEHGTLITIKKMTKGMGPRSVGKTKKLLASMYRRDLAKGRINLYFNGSKISFDEYPLLEFRGRQWRKPLNFDVRFGGYDYHVQGFVGIMNPGSFPKAGFALFRRDRVVTGGEDQNYKPQQIFGQQQSQSSLKLFGELDMDDFPVNQAKDGFIWDDGLEDEFVSVLKNNIKDFIDIANMSTKARAKEEQFSKGASERVEGQVRAAIEESNAYVYTTDESQQTDEPDSHSIDSSIDLRFDGTQDFEELKRIRQLELDEENSQPSELVGDTRHYHVQINSALTKDISITWKIGNDRKWIEVSENPEEGIGIVVNINHPFFKPYSNEEEFQVVLEKFVIAFVVSEEQAKSISNEVDYIPSSAIRMYMNEFLARLGG